MVNQLPQGWKEVLFNSIFDVCNSGKEKIKQSEYLPKADGLLPVVDQGQNLVSGYSDQFQKVVLAKDNPLIVFGDHTRCVKYIDFDFVVGADGTQLIRTKENTLVKLGYYQLMSANIPNNGYSRHFKYVKEQTYKLIADKGEQKYIVDTLDAVAEMIKLRKETIDLTKKLIPAIFQEMFGDPITNPKGWEMQAIKENKNVVSTGRTPPTKYNNMFGGDIPFITPGDLDNDQIVSERTLTEEGAKYSRLVRAGATLVCCIGNIGKTNITSQISAFNQQINAIEWNNKYYNDIFGVYLLKLLKPIFSSFGGAVVPILNKSSFESIRIIRPPLSLQDEFAKKVEQINKYIVAQQEELEHFETLFQSLLQEAFTGVLTWKYPREESND